jgi:CheY-like chemotaxis protein
VADDDHGVRRLLTKVLEGAGYAVVAARDGYDACEIVRDLHPHVIILDLRMPRMSGAEFLSTSAAADIPILILSGHLADPRSEEGLKANIVGRLAKPVDLNVLRDHVKLALSRWRP